MILGAFLWIAFGGALGSVARYAASNAASLAFGQDFPVGTLLINIAGSFVIGFFATLTGPDGRMIAPDDIRQFVIVGLCGGFTTFSSFSYQTLALTQDGEFIRAGANVVGSVVLCLAAVWLGYVAAAALNTLRGG